jgi:hypothetical protein
MVKKELHKTIKLVPPPTQQKEKNHIFDNSSKEEKDLI